ncbi:MAG TPA: pitrilysin family protein [Gemmatimonadaceae bacterium]|nr:pitrilysin family protein [Gemmatimonadaceae bacterium]
MSGSSPDRAATSARRGIPEGAGLERTVLPNGLTVLSEHMPGVRSVAFGAWVRAASVHEPVERMGVSHLLEHMVFKGTPRRSARDIALALEAVGGSLDAYTAREHTSFQARVLDEHMELAVDVIGDLIFQPALRQDDLQLERRVVLEEISTVEDTPDDLVFELHNETMWGSHPYGYSILGTRDTVSSLGASELRELHERAYHPPQIVVAAAGNVRHDDLLGVLERTGWTAVPHGDARPLVAPPPAAAPPTTRHVPRDTAQTHIVLGTPTVPHADPRRYALVLTSLVLGGGMSSRLFQRIREVRGLAYAVHTFQSFLPDTGVHGVYVGTAPETAREAATAILDELARLAASGLPDDELAMGKSQLKGQITLSLESPTSRMYRAASVDLYDSPYRPLDAVLSAIDAITPDEVRAVAAEFFAPERQTLLSLGPEPAA